MNNNKNTTHDTCIGQGKEGTQDGDAFIDGPARIEAKRCSTDVRFPSSACMSLAHMGLAYGPWLSGPASPGARSHLVSSPSGVIPVLAAELSGFLCSDF